MFKPYESMPAKKVASRPSRFKLAYVGNSEDQDRKGFGMESDTKTKDCFSEYPLCILEYIYVSNYMYYRESQIC